MCLLCVEYQQGRLKLEEAARNLREMRYTLTPEHAEEVEVWIREERLQRHDRLRTAYQKARQLMADVDP